MSEMSEFENDFTKIFMRGVCMVSEGEYEEAIRLFDQVLGLEPVFADAYAHRGYAKFHLDQYNESLEDLHTALEYAPDSVDAYAFLARTLWAIGQPEEAFQNVSHAIELDSENIHALHVRAFINMQIDHNREAVADFDTILTNSPDDSDALFMRGWAKMNIGKPEDALNDNDKGLEIDPYDAKLHLQRAVFYGALERYEEALASSDRAVQFQYEGNRSPLNQKGWALLLLRRYEEALAVFLEIFEKEKMFQQLYGMAIALGCLGQIDECRERLKEAAAIAAEENDLVNERFFRINIENLTEQNAASLQIIEAESARRFWYPALEKLEHNEQEEALRLLDEVTARNPLLLGAYANKSIIYQEQERYEKALAEIDKSLALEPESISYRYRRGMILIDLERYEESATLFSELIALEPDEPAHHYQRARAHQLSDQTEKALEDLNIVCQQDPDNEMVLSFRAACHRTLENYAKAVDDYSHILYLHPQNQEALYWRSIFYQFEFDKIEEAIRDETRLIEIDTEFQPAYRYRGRAWGELWNRANQASRNEEKLPVRLTEFFGKEFFDKDECLANAFADLTRAIELEPENDDAYGNRGYYRYWNKDFHGSIADFQKVLTINDQTSSTYYWLGRAYSAVGKYRNAIEMFDKALELDPEDNESFFNRGCAKQKIHCFEDAERDLRTAYEKENSDAWTIHYLGHNFEWQGRFEESLEYFRKASDLNPDMVEWYCCYAAVLMKTKQIDEAIRQLNKTIEIDPKQAQPYFYLGEIYEERNEPTKAAEYYQLAIRPDDSLQRSQRESETINQTYRAYAHAKLGRHELALERYEDLIRQGQEECENSETFQSIAYRKAESLYALERFAEALEQYKIALEYLTLYHDRKEYIDRCRERIAELMEDRAFGMRKDSRID
ncbi:MAG: tetratricopeptide repeat protein [Planctomycetaceae bacterium]|jgi:superkiller protein 3|nr:tetratricopeptide repeat protein [Planctomycetaceae bacterium]